MPQKNPYIDEMDRRNGERGVAGADLPLLALAWEVRQLREALTNVLAARV